MVHPYVLLVSTVQFLAMDLHLGARSVQRALSVRFRRHTDSKFEGDLAHYTLVLAYWLRFEERHLHVECLEGDEPKSDKCKGTSQS